MTGRELAERAADIARNYKTLYVYGCFGAPLTGRNVARYTQNNDYNRRKARTAMIRAAADQTPPVYGFDCVCLLKGILWGWSGDSSRAYGGARYKSNGVPDTNANGMIGKCAVTSKDWGAIVPGAVVWKNGHIGVYIGDGLAVECTPKWRNCVQITAVGNIGKKPGYNTRTWTKWGLLPYVDYTEKEDVDDMTKEETQALIDEAVTKAAQDMSAVVLAAARELREELGPREYNTPEECPAWSREAVRWAVESGYIRGDEAGRLRLDDNKVWALQVTYNIMAKGE